MKMKNGRISQAEAAARAGISQSAVSSFICDPETRSISDEKKKLLISLMRENGWELFPKRRASLGLVAKERGAVSGAMCDFYNNFYEGIIDSAGTSGKRVVIYRDTEDWEKFLQRSFAEVNGLIVVRKPGSAQLRQMLEYHQAVLINQESEELLCDTVMPDNKGGIGAAVSHLAGKGHRKFGFFGLYGKGCDYHENLHFYKRLDGFYESLRRHSLDVEKDRVKIYEAKEAASCAEIGIRALEAIKSWEEGGSFPTAVICPGDDYAVQFMNAAREAGYKIPGDFSVTGFDNRQMCDFSSPGLTSVAYRAGEIAEAGVDLLLKRLGGDKSNPKKVVCSLDLVIRGSTGDVQEESRRKKESGATARETVNA